MTHLLNAMSAEILKSKRTLAFWLTLIAPAVVVGLEIAMMQDQQWYYRQSQGPDFSAWITYMHNTLILWAILMLPLFITLETALVAQWEHRSQQWKHLFALPVSRWALYAAKQLCGMALIGISSVALAVLIIASGMLFRLLFPGLGFEDPVPLFRLGQFTLLMFLGSWLAIASQTWIAQRWSSFAVASAVGIALTVIGVIVVRSDTYGGLYPYTLPALIINEFSENAVTPLAKNGTIPIAATLFGSLGGVAAAVIGGWHFTRRDVL